MRGGGKETLIPAVLLAVEMWVVLTHALELVRNTPSWGFFFRQGVFQVFAWGSYSEGLLLEAAAAFFRSRGRVYMPLAVGVCRGLLLVWVVPPVPGRLAVTPS